MSVIVLCYLFQNIYVHSTIPCGYRFANMYKLSVIVIDKPIGLGGTISTCKSIFMSYLCTIYHQNKIFETNINTFPEIFIQIDNLEIKHNIHLQFSFLFIVICNLQLPLCINPFLFIDHDYQIYM